MLVSIFFEIDEFCKQFEKQISKNILTDGNNKRVKIFSLSLSEIITISIFYHNSGYKTFKDYYEKQVLVHMKGDFRNLVSYNRFLELRKKSFLPMLSFMQLNGLRSCTGISFIDSFPLNVCHPKREYSHKVFKGLAKKGKTSVGWFYGFKLHVVINHKGEFIAFSITPGNVADNNENVLIKLTKKLFGKLFGDRGYIVNEKLFKKMYEDGLKIVTKLRKNMQNKLMEFEDKLFLRKRGAIESVGSILKESLSLEHSRHRSVLGFFCHIFSCIIAYNFREKKPSIAAVFKLDTKFA